MRTLKTVRDYFLSITLYEICGVSFSLIGANDFHTQGQNENFLLWASLGGYALIWAIRGRADGKAMVFRPRCPKQGVEF